MSALLVYLAFKANDNTVVVRFNIQRRGFSCEKPFLRAAFLAESYHTGRGSRPLQKTRWKRGRGTEKCARELGKSDGVNERRERGGGGVMC